MQQGGGEQCSPPPCVVSECFPANTIPGAGCYTFHPLTWHVSGAVRNILVIVLNSIFVLLAIGVIYGAFVVPVYNFIIRPVKAGRDIFIVVFSVIFTVAFLQILWSIHGDLHRWLG